LRGRLEEIREAQGFPAGSKSQQDAVNDVGAHDVDLMKVTREMWNLQDAAEKAKEEFEKYVAEVVVE
jgi:predicted TIM-barrel fold metal-dependent hydrolase